MRILVLNLVLFSFVWMIRTTVADDAPITDERLTAGWEESQFLALQSSIKELARLRQSYNTLSIQRSIVGPNEDGPRRERHYRKCALVRTIGDVTWIRYVYNFGDSENPDVTSQTEWIIDGDRILQVGRAGSSTNARCYVGLENRIGHELQSLRSRVIYPNRLWTLPLSLRRISVRYRVNSDGIPRCDIDLSRSRPRPGEKPTQLPPTPGGDLRIFLSKKVPHLPNSMRRIAAPPPDSYYLTSPITRFFYDRTPGKPVFLNRVVQITQLREGKTGQTFSDTRYEPVEMELSEIPRIKIADSMHSWQVVKDNRWTKVPVEEIPQEYRDHVEVIGNVATGKLWHGMRAELTSEMDRMEAVQVPPATDLPPVAGDNVNLEPTAMKVDEQGLDAAVSDQPRRALVAGIAFLLAGATLLAAFGYARWKTLHASTNVKEN